MDDLTILVAKFLIIVPVLASIYLAWSLEADRRKAYLITLLISGAAAYLLAYLGSLVFENPRPFVSDGVEPLFAHASDNGFPSTHTLLAGVLAFSALVYSRSIGIGLAVVAALIGWARVAAGVHHGIDVLGSLAIAGLAVLAADFFVRNRVKKTETVQH